MGSMPVRWLKIALFNLVIVATIGVTLRYKILFPLPFIDQKHLLHGHSHFAFAGWISQAIMVLMVMYLAGQTGPAAYKRYGWLLIANLVTAYGMLIGFPIEGYGPVTITISMAYTIVSYIFAVLYWRDLNKLPKKDPSHLWFKAAVLFNAISSVGEFALAIMMITRIIHQNWYLAAEYYYIHFQYNGWFFFGCMGLFTMLLSRISVPAISLHKIFWMFAGAAVPAYFLSTLWMHLPLWIYILVILSAVAQVVGWIWFLRIVKARWGVLKKDLSATAKWLMSLSAIALSVKLLLQLGSTIPTLSDLAFGFRPIVIGYLHLVLLGVISLFLLGSIFSGKHFHDNKQTNIAVSVFVTGVIVNEVVLMVQGVRAISYNTVPFANEMLLGTALILFSGALLMFISAKNNFLQN